MVKRGAGYSVVVELDRDPVTGKRRQKWHSGFSTKRAAERALSEMISAVHAGTFIEPTSQTLGEHLTEWLAAIEPTIRPATHYSYSRNIRLHVIPRLGSVLLRRVDGGMLNTLYAVLLTDGKRSNGGGGLAPRTVHYIHTILHRAFRDAVRWGRLARNPADAADPPRASASNKPTMKTWTAEQVRAFLQHAAGHRLYAAFLLLATTGMRRGEALGLRWCDLDLVAGRASVVQTVIVVNHQVRDRLAEDGRRASHGRARRGHRRRAAGAPAAPSRRAAADGCRLHRPRSGVLPPGWRSAAPGAVQPHLQRAGSKGRAAIDPATRPQAHLGHTRAVRWGASAGGPGAPRTRHSG